MDSFKLLYRDLCLSLKVPECEEILSRIEDGLSASVLNLSNIHITDDTCRVLGYVFMKDVHLRELDCSNCLFSIEGLMNIFSGIEKNKFLLALNLKGNNIRSSGTECIGKLLRHNNHLQNLCLEWNGVGIFPEKFAVLCEGLSINNSLKFLDLRENQLNDIAAQSLSDALSRNSTLQKIDLRWNNIGLMGGRALLKALSKNKSLLSLEISGNNIPRDILNALEISTEASAERYISNREQIERTQSLASKLLTVEEEKNLQLKTLMEVLENKEKEASNYERWNSLKMEELKDTLVEKIESIGKLATRVKELENVLSEITKERNNFALSLNEIEKRNTELMAEHQAGIAKERRTKEEIQKKLLEDLGSMKEENLFLKSEVQELTSIKSQSEGKISKLLLTVSKLETQLRIEHNSYEEQTTSLNEKHAENLREITLLHRKEMLRVKEEFSEAQNVLQQKNLRLEKQKSNLTEDIQKKDVQISSQKIQFEESHHQIEKRLQSEKDKLKIQMEERIEILEAANKKQEDTLKEHLDTMYDLKTKITALDLSLAEGAHHAQYLQQCIEEKDTEKEAAIVKARLEFKEKLEEFNNLKIQFEELNKTNDALKQNIAGIERKHIEALKLKDEMIQNLKIQLEEMKIKINRLAEEEQGRTLQLEKAFQTYIIEVKQARKKDISSDVPSS